MDIDNLSQDQLDGMSMEDLTALAQGTAETAGAPEETPIIEPEAIENQMGQTPLSEAVEAPQEEIPTAQPDSNLTTQQTMEKQGNPEVPLARLREEKAQLATQLQQVQAFLNDPEAVRNYLQQLSPGELPEFGDDPDAAFEARTAPLMQRLQALESQLAQRDAEAARMSMMQELGSKHGPEFHSLLAEFDAANPHLVDAHPEVRYFTALGLRAKASPAPTGPVAPDPALIRAEAEKLLAERLAGGQSPRGIPTLGSAPQAREEKAAPDVETLSQGDMERMSFADLQRLARGG